MSVTMVEFVNERGAVVKEIPCLS